MNRFSRFSLLLQCQYLILLATHFYLICCCITDQYMKSQSRFVMKSITSDQSIKVSAPTLWAAITSNHHLEKCHPYILRHTKNLRRRPTVTACVTQRMVVSRFSPVPIFPPTIRTLTFSPGSIIDFSPAHPWARPLAKVILEGSGLHVHGYL